MGINSIDIHNSTNWQLNRIGSELKYRKTILPFLLLILTYVSVNQWNTFKIGNTATTWLLELVIMYCLWQEKRFNHLQLFSKPYTIVGLYLTWAFIGVLRGIYVAENYWEYKRLVECSLITLFPVCVYALVNPNLMQRILRFWVTFALPSVLIPIFWNVGRTQFYMGPVYMLACFIPLIPYKKWRWILLLILFYFLTYNIEDNRSQFIKAFVSLSICWVTWRKKKFDDFVLRIAHWFLYITVPVFLYLGLSGIFNVFDGAHDRYEGQYVSSADNHTDMSADTRTFIYEEVISSAVKHNYVLFGRTQARGNDAVWFYDQIDDDLWSKRVENFKHERSKNEVCFPNIFTWLGLVGMFFYIGIYITASVKGMYYSNNYYVKLVSLYVAFNFLYGWIENCTTFDILNFNYWMMISICLSPFFRRMTNVEFVAWVRDVFPKI